MKKVAVTIIAEPVPLTTLRSMLTEMKPQVVEMSGKKTVLGPSHDDSNKNGCEHCILDHQWTDESAVLCIQC